MALYDLIRLHDLLHDDAPAREIDLGGLPLFPAGAPFSNLIAAKHPCPIALVVGAREKRALNGVLHDRRGEPDPGPGVAITSKERVSIMYVNIGDFSIVVLPSTRIRPGSRGHTTARLIGYGGAVGGIESGREAVQFVAVGE